LSSYLCSYQLPFVNVLNFKKKKKTKQQGKKKKWSKKKTNLTSQNCYSWLESQNKKN